MFLTHISPMLCLSKNVVVTTSEFSICAIKLSFDFFTWLKYPKLMRKYTQIRCTFHYSC